MPQVSLGAFILFWRIEMAKRSRGGVAQSEMIVSAEGSLDNKLVPRDRAAIKRAFLRVMGGKTHLPPGKTKIHVLAVELLASKEYRIGPHPSNGYGSVVVLCTDEVMFRCEVIPDPVPNKTGALEGFDTRVQQAFSSASKESLGHEWLNHSVLHRLVSPEDLEEVKKSVGLVLNDEEDAQTSTDAGWSSSAETGSKEEGDDATTRIAREATIRAIFEKNRTLKAQLLLNLHQSVPFEDVPSRIACKVAGRRPDGNDQVNATNYLNRLVEEGFLKKEKRPGKRIVHFSLTETGKTFVTEVHGHQFEVPTAESVEKVEEGTEDELLKRLLDELEKHRIIADTLEEQIRDLVVKRMAASRKLFLRDERILRRYGISRK